MSYLGYTASTLVLTAKPVPKTIDVPLVTVTSVPLTILTPFTYTLIFPDV
jgi:hypothetical protein